MISLVIALCAAYAAMTVLISRNLYRYLHKDCLPTSMADEEYKGADALMAWLLGVCWPGTLLWLGIKWIVTWRN